MRRFLGLEDENGIEPELLRQGSPLSSVEVIASEYHRTRVPSTRAYGKHASMDNLVQLLCRFLFFSSLSFCDAHHKTD